MRGSAGIEKGLVGHGGSVLNATETKCFTCYPLQRERPHLSKEGSPRIAVDTASKVGTSGYAS